MIDPEWIQSSSTALTMVVLSGVGIYLVLMLFARLAGLPKLLKNELV